jgi:CubicO group peptidase (beta-lactamase class C family)
VTPRLAHLTVALCLSAASHAAAQGFTFPRSSPESQGIPSKAILAFVEEAESAVDALHSVMIVRHGRVVAEGWWAPYAAAEPHMMFSLSKSFTSTAVGMAVAEGRLTVDDPVLGFFPDLGPAEPSANLKAMRVRDLLTMSTGHHVEDIQGFPYSSDENLVARFLSLPVAHKPGTHFVYNTPASYMLSAIVQKVTGETVLDYLRPRLFAPLGITDPHWEASRQGVSMGGFGLSVRTEDIARFGQLFLQKGEWQGRPLLPASWVEQATSRQVGNGSSPSSDWEQGYGFQFWRSRHGFYRGDGAHGQFCLVLPQHDVVIAITAGTRDMGAVMNLVWTRLVPAFSPTALPPDEKAGAALSAKLKALRLPPVEGTAGTAASTPSGRYAFPANRASLESVAIERADGGAQSIVLTVSGTEQRFTAAPGQWRTATWTRTRGIGTPSPAAVNLQRTEPIAVSGAWTRDGYTLKVVRYHTPFVVTYRLKFAGEAVTAEVEQNVGPADQRLIAVTGTAAPVGTAAGAR